jgi:hypothetical protein
MRGAYPSIHLTFNHALNDIEEASSKGRKERGKGMLGSSIVKDKRNRMIGPLTSPIDANRSGLNRIRNDARNKEKEKHNRR